MLSFADWLRQRRLALDLTRAELARAVSCSPGLVYKLESGERRPSRQIAELLADRLGVPPAQREALVEFARAVGTQPPPAPPTLDPPQASARREALPRPAGRLLGREGERALLAGMLADPARRLITLVGPGGAGKTRLALEAARDQPRPVCFVALAALNRPELLATTILTALGVTGGGALSPPEQLAQALHGAQQLLVLDNIDQLLAPDSAGAMVAALIGVIVEQAPAVKLLVTSRERLNLRSEWVVDVAGLPLAPAESAGAGPSPAAELFIAAAQRAHHRFDPTAAEREAIDQICRLTDGMPLALELAAAWASTLSCAEIAAELARSPDLLESRLRDTPARHRSMRAVFAQSWAMLSGPERETLTRLALFESSFTREAAGFVAQSPLRRLATLVQKSLLRRTDGQRYDMHPIVRHYSREQLAATGAQDLVQRRLLDYYLAFAGQAGVGISSAEQLAWLDEVTRELDNLRAALEAALGHAETHETGAQICTALRRYWSTRGPFREAVGWAERFLASGAISAVARARLLVAVSHWSRFLDEHPRAVATAGAALVLQRAGADPVGLADALHALATAESESGLNELALAHFEEALGLWRAADAAYELTATRINLANVLWDLGELGQARAMFATVAAEAGPRGFRNERAIALGNLAMLAAQQDDLAGMAVAVEALDELLAVGNRAIAAYCLEVLAARAGAGGDPQRGAQLIGAADTLREQIQSPVTPNNQAHYQRSVALARGNLEAAAFDAARAAGRELPFAHALELAHA